MDSRVTVDSTYSYLDKFFSAMLAIVCAPIFCCTCFIPFIGIFLLVFLLVIFISSFSNGNPLSAFSAKNVKTFISGDEITFVTIRGQKSVFNLKDFDFLYDKEKDIIRCRGKNKAKSLNLLLYSNDSFGYESFKQYLIDKSKLKVVRNKME